MTKQVRRELKHLSTVHNPANTFNKLFSYSSIVRDRGLYSYRPLFLNLFYYARRKDSKKKSY